MVEKVVKFPGQFHKSDENGSREQNDTRPLAEVVDISPDRESQDVQIGIQSFFERINTIRERDTSVLWYGTNARKMDEFVAGYTMEQLIYWALQGTDSRIKAKPLFYSSIAERLARELEA
jgi:hypothetical protein